MKRFRYAFTCLVVFVASLAANDIDHLVFEPDPSNANGKNIVLISGDEEYRSEETCPMLAKILSQRFGFKCTVLFAIDKETGCINPNENSNIPGLESLEDADLMILGTRWRVLPSEQLKPILDYLNAGKPIIGFRTATHAFNNDDHFGGYDWQNFGKTVIGENWHSHHGEHKVQGGRGIIVPENASHPILNSVTDIFTWSDIYGVVNLDQESATVLLRGAVTESLDPNSKPIEGPKNNPTMPLAWLKSYPTPDGNGEGICFATTAGASTDFQKEDLRRLFVNASHYLLNLPVPTMANVDTIDPFEPSLYGFQQPDYFVERNLRVSDYKLGQSARSIASQDKSANQIKLKTGSRIVLLGNGLSERMLNYGFFETELYLSHPEKELFVRNLSHPGDTPAFRPHPSRKSQWAFPGASEFYPEYAIHSGEGHYPTPDEWLQELKPDIIVAFWGFNESFQGSDGIENFRAELDAFVKHTLSQNYNDKNPPQLALVSPIAFQDLSIRLDLPNGDIENRNLELYAKTIKEVSQANEVAFVDLFQTTKDWFNDSEEQLTVNGAHLNENGYKKLAPILSEKLFGKGIENEKLDNEAIHELVLDKSWYWFNDYQMPNGVHAYGRRWEPFGHFNYPEEIEKLKELTANRDRAIWAALSEKNFDLIKADADTRSLTPVSTNAGERLENEYLYGEDAMRHFEMAEGYEIELFASESMFEDLANPVQLSFDGKGRLWVAVMPSYPHYRAGDPRPNDKILIFEDTDNDGRADKETVFADGLHLPIGFELTSDGVYVSQAPNLVLLKDIDGDDRADFKEIILSGFDTHDTHHAISAFCADPSGAIVMGEGVFLHTNVETAYGPVRGMNGGFWRFDPKRQHLDHIVQTNVPNPWGIAFDDWGQDFYLDTSSPNMRWMLPAEIKARYGVLSIDPPSLIEPEHRVRPTSGLEFISSRHFPSEVQGDFLLNNSIGFLGAKQHRIQDDGTGYSSTFRQDLFASSDPNFRPVDLEFAPDGSLYVVDWHNQLIGHMQHSARDPLRDHAHGRVYRITHSETPLVTPAKIEGVSLDVLFENLKLHEYRSRYRTRREIRGRPVDETLKALSAWTENLDTSDTLYEHSLLEALWVTWGFNRTDPSLLERLLKSKSYQFRAAAVRALRFNTHLIPNHVALLKAAAADSHGRVRLETIVTGSWLDNENGREIVEIAGRKPIDSWMRPAYEFALRNLGGTVEYTKSEVEVAPSHLTTKEKLIWEKGAEIYARDGYCSTCHQADGNGLPAANFPPLAGTSWVNGDERRLIDITLHGLLGQITVKDRSYPGHVPMTAFRGMLNDEEIAAVLTYVRNSFGNQSPAISTETVKDVRKESGQKDGFWTAEELDKKYQ